MLTGSLTTSLAALFVCFASLLQPAAVPVSDQAPPPAAAPLPGALPPNADIDSVLRALWHRGDNLQAFDADVSLADADAATGSETTRAGRFLYRKTDNDDAQIRVTLETRDEGTGPRPFRIEYLLERSVLTDRNYPRKVEVRRQVARPGQKINLFRLGEGPFPLPIGQKPEEVQKQFTVTRLDPEGGSPRLRLVPRPGTRIAGKFSQIDVTVDPVSHFPVKIETTDPNATAVRTTTLRNLRINPAAGLQPADFALPAVGPDWKTTDETYSD